jgi:DNA (cytosine-5)-methyltransferase 1
VNALDLYSGIGGWGLGMSTAGIYTIRGFDIWPSAVFTYNANLKPIAEVADIRNLNPSAITREQIDVIVGSPPCTQFSLSNRGGNGNIQDGLVDIKKFLEIVDYLQPKFWVMENVPRLSRTLDTELSKGGCLYQYRKLVTSNEVVDMSEYGLPQRRRRVLAGTFPLSRLKSYRRHLRQRTLGEVVQHLAANKVKDPIYGIAGISITERQHEPALDNEELRLNRESKEHHPIYNLMRFPDALNRPSRTVTAVCTRVARESIIVRDALNPELYRRLNVRERASLQGFPIDFQFFGNSHAEKLKMIGNAIPPLITFYIANAILGIEAESLPDISTVRPKNSTPKTVPVITSPAKNGRKFSVNRTFKTAIVNLRFGSGMRFELSNQRASDRWNVSFYYGTSKNILSIPLNSGLLKEVQRLDQWYLMESVYNTGAANLNKMLALTNHEHIQAVWARRLCGNVSPLEISDELGSWAKKIAERIYINRDEVSDFVHHKLLGNSKTNRNGRNAKIEQNAVEILAGFVVGSWFNTEGTAILEISKSAA